MFALHKVMIKALYPLIQGSLRAELYARRPWSSSSMELRSANGFGNLNLQAGVES